MNGKSEGENLGLECLAGQAGARDLRPELVRTSE